MESFLCDNILRRNFTGQIMEDGMQIFLDCYSPSLHFLPIVAGLLKHPVE